MSIFIPKNNNIRVVNSRRDFSRFQQVWQEKYQQQLRNRRQESHNSHRPGFVTIKDVQGTLTRTVCQKLEKLSTTEESESSARVCKIINSPLQLDEALQEESEILAEQEQWILHEYEKLMNNEDEMFDMLEDEIVCPMCKKSFLGEIPDFIVCNCCGLKLKTDMSLQKFKYNLEFCVNMHSESCLQVPCFSLAIEDNNLSLLMSCLTCSNYFLIRTIESP
ncbi:hypothetical protein QAD02_015976 [Eretmocerus hayati]|uniref:Uncharacterized protein n=1 Tax=Eretmocerus hayati TaxID=131215 RepID=A0ACC2PA67_9HYME|nr:hypothetical protein QAD02_015976 [Eretmocerus hayati]